MAIQDEGVFEHKEFKGLRNTVGADAFELGDLEAATNVDIDDAGDASVRRGHPAASIAGASHSLWSDGTTCLAVIAGTLTQILPSLATQSLRTGMGARPVSYDSVAGRVYYTNGVQTGVVENGASRSWGLEVPTTIAAVAVPGALPAGRYQFALTYVRTDGQESGAARAGYLELTAPGGLSFPALPVSTDPDVIEKALYVTKMNGSALYYAHTVLAATTSTTFTDPRLGTAVLSTQHLSPPPASDIVAYFAGRVYVAAGDTLYPSRPYAYELFDLREAIRLGDQITLVGPVTDGLFVAAGARTVFLAGRDPAGFDLRPLATYGAIPRTSYRESTSALDPARKGSCVIWASTRGVCAGFDGGDMVNLTESRFAYPVQETGAAVVRPWRGTQQFLTTLRGTETPGNIAG